MYIDFPCLFKLQHFPFAYLIDDLLCFYLQLWVWDHFTFMRPIPPSVPKAGMPFPQGLYWSRAAHAPEAVTGHRYVGRLFFEMLVLA